MNKVFFFGTTGGCLDSFYLHNELSNNPEALYFLSDDHFVGERLYTHEVAGSFESIESIDTTDCYFVYQCGSSRNHINRHIWYERALLAGMIPKTLISKDSYVH